MTRTPLTWDEYAVQWAGLHGGVDPRRSGGFMLGWLRLAYALGRTAARLRIRPATVTVIGLLLSLAVPVLVNQGYWWALAAAGVVVLSALADSVDGAVAVTTGRTSRLGFVYDSIADRISELAWLAGLKLLGVPGWLVVVCAAIAWLHEYLRARAVAAGMSDVGVVTAAERPTRVVFAVLGLGLGGIAGLITKPLAAGTATGATAIWVLFGLIGLAQLISAVNARLRGRSTPRTTVANPHSLPRDPGRGAGGALSVALPDRPADGLPDAPPAG